MGRLTKARRISKTQAIVLEKIAGLDVRQVQREAAREMLARVRHLYRARRDGHLDTMEKAVAFCKGIGLMGIVESYYGLQILHTSAGVTLAFAPDGRPCWRMMPPLSATNDVPENLVFCFNEPANGSTNATISAPPSASSPAPSAG